MPGLQLVALARYSLAVLIIVAAFLLRLVFVDHLDSEMPFITYYPAVVLAAVLCGYGAGLLATFLASVLTLLFGFPAAGLLLPHPGPDIFAIAMFLVTGVFVSLVMRFYQGEREKALAYEKAAQFRAFFDHAAVGAAQVDLQGRFVRVNDRYCQITGYSREELLQLTPRDITHPDERDADWGRYLRFRQGETDIYEAEKRYVRKDDSVIWVLVTAGLVRDVQGHVLGTAGIVQDITERKAGEEWLRQSEEQFHQLADGMPHLGWTACPDGRIDYINQRYREFDGFRYTAEHGWEWQRVIHPDDIEETTERWDRAMKTGELYEIEHRLRRSDGQYRWHLCRALPLRDEHNHVTKWFGTATDIDTSKRQEAELKAARDAAEQAKAAAENANRFKTQFLANISHELRTPMNAILGMTQLALHENLSANLRDQLQTVKESADSLLALLNDLLDFSRIESGKLQLEIAPFSLRQAIEATTKLLRVRAEEKGLRLTHSIADTVPDRLLGDAMRFQQILVNLVGNAIKFTEHGEINVSARTLSQNRDEATLLFAVSDSGIGISPEQQSKIFAPFVQGDASTTRLYGGTGLGLAICQRLIGMMNGELCLDSQMGRGSTFSFNVRLAVAKEPLAPPSPTSDLPATPQRRLCVLLAEDNPANRKLAKYILEDRGHTVHVADDGRQALALVEQNHYDAILMDVQMPGMDGLEATRELRARENRSARVPIIAMTAYAMKGDRERCLAAGMNAYLAKPIDGRTMIFLVEMLAAHEAGEVMLSPSIPHAAEHAS